MAYSFKMFKIICKTVKKACKKTSDIIILGFKKKPLCGCGGMADAQDSKSCVGDYVWVQVPPSALKKDSV